MTASSPDPAAQRLTREELARAVRVEQATLDELLAWGFLEPDDAGLFRPSDIQRVRAVMSMRSPGIDLGQLIEAFRQRLFTLQPMDLLYPVPAVVTDTTPSQLAQTLGLDERDLVRLTIAAGFPAPQPDVPLRDDDIALARRLVEIGSQMGGTETVIRTARVFGESARRAAESAVAIFDENVTSQVPPAQADDEARMALNRVAAELMAKSEQVLADMYRRHLEHALLRLWAGAAEVFLDQIGVRPARPQVHGLAFVDLTGYTALTEAGGDSAGARLAVLFGELAEEAAATHNGRVVKLLGDGAMLHFDDGHAAVRGALALVGSIAASDLPPAHAGVHAGPVIERDGDYFGHTVNLAARIGSQAVAGQVLASAEVASVAAADLVFQPAGQKKLKGLGETAIYEARWRSVD